ncbi:nascent polypeptide-associated complex subunit alpha, muscle-specific form-like [Eublepharis macularius]|uniref:Nascent polypeptide-associated complex subunit alpha, muscle-specific form-like n=1 Tax=Eublepharis macularius TaxID=481883 RepID=A0AA97L1E3_EUBMA|nr:nascent polypeptide-associated complex subunit alpha, muscle-specific form-like [Eublepharis macularius]
MRSQRGGSEGTPGNRRGCPSPAGPPLSGSPKGVLCPSPRDTLRSSNALHLTSTPKTGAGKRRVAPSPRATGRQGQRVKGAGRAGLAAPKVAGKVARRSPEGGRLAPRAAAPVAGGGRAPLSAPGRPAAPRVPLAPPGATRPPAASPACVPGTFCAAAFREPPRPTDRGRSGQLGARAPLPRLQERERRRGVRRAEGEELAPGLLPPADLPRLLLLLPGLFSCAQRRASRRRGARSSARPGCNAKQGLRAASAAALRLGPTLAGALRGSFPALPLRRDPSSRRGWPAPGPPPPSLPPALPPPARERAPSGARPSGWRALGQWRRRRLLLLLLQGCNARPARRSENDRAAPLSAAPSPRDREGAASLRSQATRGAQSPRQSDRPLAPLTLESRLASALAEAANLLGNRLVST